jgi:hypothetical protein
VRRSEPPRRRRALRRQAGLARRSGLKRSGRLERRAELRRRTPLARTPVSPASEAQRAKVAGQGCLVCGTRPVDPAHLAPRALGGCDHPDCVVPLCRAHHRTYDRGELDLLPRLEPARRAELAHALSHLGLLALLLRLTGKRWYPCDNQTPWTSR